MLTLTEKLREVNELRKKAQSDPEFIRSAKAHERAIMQQDQCSPRQLKEKRQTTKQKSFADIYYETNFTTSPAGMQH